MSGRSAAEHVGSIKDLMVEILVRVPAKPVTRLKLVSKKFCSLISDPQFVQSHAQVNNYSSGMFLYTSTACSETDFFWLTETQTPPPSLTFLNGVFGEGYKVWILQSCSGLFLCCYSNITVDCASGMAGNLFICNPSTKHYRKLPPPENVSEWSASNFYFAFDPSVSPHYKLVCVEYNEKASEESRFQVEVYSSQHHIWRPLKEFNMHGGGKIERYSHWQPVFVNSEHFHFDLNFEALVRIPKGPPHPSMDISVNYSLGYNVIDYYDPSILCVSLRHHAEDSSISIHDSIDFSNSDTRFRVKLCHLTAAYPEIVGTGKCDERQRVKGEDYKFQAFGIVKGL